MKIEALGRHQVYLIAAGDDCANENLPNVGQCQPVLTKNISSDLRETLMSRLQKNL